MSYPNRAFPIAVRPFSRAAGFPPLLQLVTSSSFVSDVALSFPVSFPPSPALSLSFHLVFSYFLPYSFGSPVFPARSRLAPSVPLAFFFSTLHRLTLHSLSFRRVSSRFPFSFSYSLAQRAQSPPSGLPLSRGRSFRVLSVPPLSRLALSFQRVTNVTFISSLSLGLPIRSAKPSGSLVSRSRRRSSFVFLCLSSDPTRCLSLAST